MKFNEKKEYYSLRKFKGVGLASALVGLAFLSPSVLAEETATPSAPAGEVGVVAPTTEPNKVETTNTSSTSESSKVENNSVAPEVANVGNTSLVTGGSAKPEEVAKPAEVVTPEVSVSPVTPSSPKAEESSQDVKPALNEGTTKPNKQDSVESSQPARSRRGKRDVSSSEESTTGNIKLFGLDGDNATLVPATGREVVTAIDYTDGSNPQKAPVGDNYNNQISKVEILSTSTSRVRVRVSLVDGETIPEGGKIQLASLGASSFASNKLLMNSTVVGSGIISESSPSNKLSPKKDLESSLKSAATVEEYLSILKGLKRFDYPVSMINLTMNSSFSSYNKNRVLEFEFATTPSTTYDSLVLKSEDLSKDGIYNSVGSLEKPTKETMGYIINPYDNSKIMNLNPFSGGTSVNTPYKDSRPVDDNLKMSDSQSFGVSSLPYFLTSASIYPLQGLEIRGGVPSATRNRLSVGDYVKTTLTNDSIFKSNIPHKVGDVVEVSVRTSSPSKTSVDSSPRFSDTDKYIVENITRTGYSQEDKKVRLRLVELTDTTIKWELLDDVKLTKDQLYLGLYKEFFNYSLREDWISRFGKDSLLNYLKSGGDPAKYTDKSKFKLTSEFSENGTPHSKDTYGSISRNPNIVWGDKSTGSVKVKYVLDTGELLKEVNLAENQPWDTHTVVDLPEKFGEAMLYSTSETGLPNTFVGIGDRTITVTYKNPISEEVSETPPTKKYVLDNSKEGTYKNEVVGTPNKVVRTVTYKFNKNSGWSEDVEDYIDVPGTPTVVTLGTKPTTEVTYQDFSTTYVADPTRTAGEKFTEIAGVRGTTTVETTYSVNKETGEVTPTKGQPVVVAPRNAVVKVGTKPTVTEKPINFTTLYEADETKGKGVRTDKVAGVHGKVITTTTYTLDESTGNVTANNPTERREEPTNKVVTVGTAPTVTTKRIAYGVEYQRDDTVSATTPPTRVQEGADGEKRTTTTFSVNPTTGVVTDNEPVETAVAPKPQIEKLGTKPEDIITTQDFKRTFVADENKDLGYRQVETQGVQGKTTVHRTYTLPENVPPVEDNGQSINYEFAVAIPHDSEPEVNAPINEVTRVGVKPKVDTQTVAITTKYVEDATLDFGQVVETEKGSEGRVVTTTTYTMNPADGTTTPNEPTVVTTPMVQRVVKVGTKPKVSVTNVPYTVEYEADPEAEAGVSSTKVTGVDGKVTTTTTYTFNSKTGEVTASEQTSVRTEPVNEVISVGSKPSTFVVEQDYEISYVGDSTKEVEFKEVISKGVNGSTTYTTTYSVNPKTGEVTSTELTPVVVTPKDEVVSVGTKPSVVVKIIPRTVRYVKDLEKAKGVTNVSVEGSDGSVTTTTTYTVNSYTGEVTSDTPTSVKVPAVDKVVMVGAKTEVVSSKDDKGRDVIDTTTYSVNPNTGEVTPSTIRTYGTTKEPTVETRVVPAPVRYEKDSSKDKGTTPLVEKGIDGEETITTTYVVDKTTGKITVLVGKPIRTKEPKETVVKVPAKDKVVVTLIESVVEYVKDLTRTVGEPNVTIPGANGSTTVTTTYMVNPKTGEVTETVGSPAVNPAKDTVIKVASKDKVEYVRNMGSVIRRTTSYEVNPKTGKVTPVNPFKEELVSSVPNDAPVVDIPEYTEPSGTTPNDAPVLDIPEFTGGVNPYNAPQVEKPEFTGGVVPNEAPVHELPEFNGRVVPNEAPILEKPELKIPEEPAPVPTPVSNKVEETPAPALQEPVQENQLPNTGGGDSAKASAFGIVSLLAGLGITARKRKED